MDKFCTIKPRPKGRSGDNIRLWPPEQSKGKNMSARKLAENDVFARDIEMEYQEKLKTGLFSVPECRKPVLEGSQLREVASTALTSEYAKSPQSKGKCRASPTNLEVGNPWVSAIEISSGLEAQDAVYPAEGRVAEEIFL